MEDDPELGTGVRIALVDPGFRVIWVRRLDEAAHELEDDHTDLVPFNPGLPDGNGRNAQKLYLKPADAKIGSCRISSRVL